MRALITTMSTVAILAAGGEALAQGGAAPAATPRLFASAGDVKAMIARAKTERKPDQPNFSQPIVGMAPFNANLEYRVGGLNAPASSHDKEAELFYVVEGSGTVVTGGTIQNERRTNPDNGSGSAIEGGMSRKIGPGDFIYVPEKTPHWFTQIDGALVLMSLHLPK